MSWRPVRKESVSRWGGRAQSARCHQPVICPPGTGVALVWRMKMLTRRSSRALPGLWDSGRTGVGGHRFVPQLLKISPLGTRGNKDLGKRLGMREDSQKRTQERGFEG